METAWYLSEQVVGFFNILPSGNSWLDSQLKPVLSKNKKKTQTVLV